MIHQYPNVACPAWKLINTWRAPRKTNNLDKTSNWTCKEVRFLMYCIMSSVESINQLDFGLHQRSINPSATCLVYYFAEINEGSRYRHDDKISGQVYSGGTALRVSGLYEQPSSHKISGLLSLACSLPWGFWFWASLNSCARTMTSEVQQVTSAEKQLMHFFK